MPIYEYQCQACGHKLEAMQKMSDPQLTDCPECEKPDLKKLMSAGGFQIKGSKAQAPCGAESVCPACPGAR